MQTKTALRSHTPFILVRSQLLRAGYGASRQRTKAPTRLKRTPLPPRLQSRGAFCVRVESHHVESWCARSERYWARILSGSRPAIASGRVPRSHDRRPKRIRCPTIRLVEYSAVGARDCQQASQCPCIRRHPLRSQAPERIAMIDSIIDLYHRNTANLATAKANGVVAIIHKATTTSWRSTGNRAPFLAAFAPARR